tara:strand:+ start:446 stop:964 length:519 start_codon:yes stop_codon:yes gene_type:complete
MKIEFSYFFSDSINDINETMEGTMFLKGGKYRIDTDNDLSIINNGETLWYFMKDVNEVQITNNDPNDSFNPNKLFTIYKNKFKNKFNGIKIFDNYKAYNISLFPEEKTNNISKITLYIHIENSEIMIANIYDKNGGVMKYIINDFITNSSLEDEIFEFKTSNYPDLEKIDLR